MARGLRNYAVALITVAATITTPAVARADGYLFDLRPKADGHACLTSGGTANLARAFLRPCVSPLPASQLWEIIYLGDDSGATWYHLRNAWSHKCLALDNNGNGGNVIQWDCIKVLDQGWNLNTPLPDDRRTAFLKNRKTRSCMSGYVSGAYVGYCTEADVHQRWVAAVGV
jgi:hypothetical protein